MNGYYRQAVKMAETLYNYMVATFAQTPCVVYCVNVDLWHNHVNIGVWVAFGFDSYEDEAQYKRISSGYTFADYTKDSPEDYFYSVIREVDAFASKAIEIQEKYDNDK